MIFAIPTDTCYGIGCNIYDEHGYYTIYDMKGRDFDKQLSILIRNYQDLLQYTKITPEQLQILREYPHPFTILVTPSEIFQYPDFLDRNKYQKIAFRIAEQCVPEDIREEISYPIFLTSANKTGESENYSSDEVTQVFSLWIDSMQIFDGIIKDRIKPSDIFEFIDNSAQIRYLRKNY